MIPYELYCKLQDGRHNRKLTVAQLARELNLNERTVVRWLARDHFRPRPVVHRPGKLDPYKPQIVRWLETQPYTATQIFLRLREQGYPGGVSIVKDYVRHVRPRRAQAFLTLAFAPGECAQVDWGQFGSIAVGQTRRRLSFFVMVLCYSRLLYVEFTVSETLEHFLAGHQHAFELFGGVPTAIMVDNLKSAVLRRAVGEAPVFNPRYKDFADHCGFRIKPCGVGQAHEKGRVENAVGYVKKNFLTGTEWPDFRPLNPAARHWLETVANVRLHGTTKQKPVDLFLKEKPALRPLPTQPYDVGVPRPVRATRRFRVTLDTNTYSVPAELAGSALLLRTYPDHLCVFRGEQLVARHPRCYDRRQDFENPDHVRELLTQRRRAHDHKLLQRLLSLAPQAETFYRELQQRRFNAPHHVRKIVALSEIYGREAVARALEDAVVFQAYSSEYIANLLEQRRRLLPEPGALLLTRRQDLLDLELPEPNLALYAPGSPADAVPPAASPVLPAAPAVAPTTLPSPDTAADPRQGEPHEPAED